MRFVSKLSHTRAGERSRIWLEGKRLAAAGFVPGLHFAKHWRAGRLSLALISEADFAALPRDMRGKVSGKGDKPIIDITGRLVSETFAGTHVAVSYSAGRINISEAQE
jgi:hypothetical protein